MAGRPKKQSFLIDDPIEQAQKSVSIQRTLDREYSLCAEDFWYCAKHFITEDEESGGFRPFPNFEYLVRFNKEVDDNRRVICLKSRRMLISWLVCMRQLYRAMFAGTALPGTIDVYRGAIMSIGETEAKHLIERISRVYHRLPQWMKDRNQLAKDNELYLEFDRGGCIQAFPLKRQGPRTFGFSEVSFDEMAFQEAVRTVWAGLLPTLGSRGVLVAVSTPNGKSNLFGEVWHNRDGRYANFYRSKVYWRDNPEHDENWFALATSGLSAQQIAREFELSWSSYDGAPVWPDFSKKAHVHAETMIAPSRPMYIGWDLGFHYPAAIFIQRNHRDQWVVHREYLNFDVSFDQFTEEVREFAGGLYGRRRTPEIFCLPVDAKLRYRNKSRTGATTDMRQIQTTFRLGADRVQIRFGMKDVGTRTNEGPRLKMVRGLWRLRADGEPGIIINERCETLIEGCMGGYCYPETKTGQYTPEEPSKNEYSHIQDAMQTVITAYNRTIEPSKKKPTEPPRQQGYGKFGF